MSFARCLVYLALLLLASCGTRVASREFPELEPGTPPIFATLAAHTDARFLNGNGVEISYMLYLFAISTARHSIYITNPYFVIDDEMEQALARAVRRGVDVMLLIPGRLGSMGSEWLGVETSLVQHAGRGGLGRLLRSGIRVFEFRPARLHAKTMVVDGIWATVGSTNLDPRSFALNKELNLTVYDANVAKRLEEVFETDLSLSDELRYETWSSRGLAARLLELFAFPAKSQL